MKPTNLRLIGVLFGILILVLMSKNVLSEAFVVPGEYPKSVEKPLLTDSYKLSKTPGISNLGASEIYVNYPVFPSGHCGTNNIRYWKRPTNGQCTPPDMCMGLYDATEQKMDTFTKIPSWEDYRVNFFAVNN
jgi:hypothetical protein